MWPEFLQFLAIWDRSDGGAEEKEENLIYKRFSSENLVTEATDASLSKIDLSLLKQFLLTDLSIYLSIF